MSCNQGTERLSIVETESRREQRSKLSLRYASSVTISGNQTLSMFGKVAQSIKYAQYICNKKYYSRKLAPCFESIFRTSLMLSLSCASVLRVGM